MNKKIKPEGPKQSLILILGLVATVPMITIIIIFSIRMSNLAKLNSYTFEDCIAAGNPAMESYPRQCHMKGRSYIEDITQICTEEARQKGCTKKYDPVCATVQVQCITTPCNPIKTTYSNPCLACQNLQVDEYAPGPCN